MPSGLAMWRSVKTSMRSPDSFSTRSPSTFVLAPYVHFSPGSCTSGSAVSLPWLVFRCTSARPGSDQL